MYVTDAFLLYSYFYPIIFLHETKSYSPRTVISDRDMDQLKQVDTNLLKQLVEGHSKCSKVFYYLEFGVLSLRHLILCKRLMFHHHILTREDNESDTKVHMKQKESTIKGDWYWTILSDLEFIEEHIDEDFIKSIKKRDYRVLINFKKIMKEHISITWNLKIKVRRH